MNNFINNSDKKQLKTRLIELLSKCKELKFLIGDFSGLKELFQGLKSNNIVKLKILAGLNVDKTVRCLLEYGNNALVQQKKESELILYK
jgi:HKD family nuclease